MRSLLDTPVLAGIKHRFDSGNRLLLFLNYDTVLAPPTADGKAGSLTPEWRKRLRELSEMNALTLTVISDHSLAAIKKLIGFSGLYFIANHGMEISGPDVNVVHSEGKRARQMIVSMVQTLHKKAAGLAGVKVEDRGLSVAVNFSQAKAAVQESIRLRVEEVWTPVMDSFTLKEKNRESVLRPRVAWGKGRALMYLWNKFASPRRRPLVVYLGTDDGEEEIYNFMGREGLGARVGVPAEDTTAEQAGYYLQNRTEVNKFISWILQNLTHLPSSKSAAG